LGFETKNCQVCIPCFFEKKGFCSFVPFCCCLCAYKKPFSGHLNAKNSKIIDEELKKNFGEEAPAIDLENLNLQMTTNRILFCYAFEFVSDIELKSFNKAFPEAQIFAEDKCVICLENDSEMIYLPCKHKIVCQACNDNKNNPIEIVKNVLTKNNNGCPICKQAITKVLKF